MPEEPLQKLHLLLVEDHSHFAQWVQATLQHTTKLSIDWAVSLSQARDMLAQQPSAWDMAIVDLNLGEDDGIDLIQALIARWPSLPVLVLTAVDDPDRAIRAIRAGGQGYILKSTEEAELLRVVRQVLSGGSPITPSIARLLLLEFRQIGAVTSSQINGQPAQEDIKPKALEPLSERETEVLQFLSRGYSNKEVARELALSASTVDFHIRKIYQKLNVNSRTALRRALGL